MSNIAKIPTNELVKDYYDSRTDMAVCEVAILQGVTEYSGGSVESRKRKNKHFMEVIAAELDRRGSYLVSSLNLLNPQLAAEKEHRMQGEVREFRTGWLQWQVTCLKDDEWGGQWEARVRSFKVTGELASEEWKVLKDRYGKVFSCEPWHKVMEACLAEERWRHPGWRNEWEYAHMMAMPSRGYSPPPPRQRQQGSWSQRYEAGIDIDDTDLYDVSDPPF